MKLNFNKKAFTLVEIMIVCVCIGLLVGPIFLLLRSGSDSSLKGMTRIETTLKARRVLQQVYADLKMLCQKYDQVDRDHYRKVNFSNSYLRDGNYPNIKYEFICFPIHEDYKDIFETNSNSYGTTDFNCNVCKITYVVEKNPKTILGTLKRTVDFKGKKTTTKLCENVNNFIIDPVAVTIDDKLENYFIINLSLVDVLHENYREKLTADEINNGSREVIKAEYFDVVYPEYVHSYVDGHAINPSWHRLINNTTN